MNEKEKQLYEALKTARNYFLKQIDVFQRQINQEYDYIGTDIDFINEDIMDILTFIGNINILEQRGDANHIIGLLYDYMEEAREDIRLLEISRDDSNYFVQKAKDKIKIYTSKINYIDNRMKTFFNK